MEPKNKLTRVILGPDWIDLGYGDTPVVKEALAKAMVDNDGASLLKFDSAEKIILDCSYQPANGYPPLVEFLENRYKTKVVVTNGAKQGMAAALYALKEVDGIDEVWMRTPYWPSITAIFEDVGVKPAWKTDDHCIGIGCVKQKGAIVTYPNNPDDSYIGESDARMLQSQGDVKIIHDAAYYTEVYAFGETTENFSHMQVFTYSKKFGLGGARVGYVVCHDPRYADKVAEFVERTTSSVSVPSQKLVLTIDQFMDNNPRAKWEFIFNAEKALKSAREEMSNIDSSVLLPDDRVDFINAKSMFAWMKIGPKLNAKKAKVHLLEGNIFGKPGFVRINLAVGPEKIKEAVRRLNKNRKR